MATGHPAIDATTTTGSEDKIEKITIDSAESNEIFWEPEYLRWKGYYDTVPELAAAIDKLAMWAVGKGFKSNLLTRRKVRKWRGFGKDSFNQVMYNQLRVAFICGDSFGERVKDFFGRTINIKPMSPENMRTVGNAQGIIIRYEQWDNSGEKPKLVDTWQPDEMFHLCWNRLDDKMGGTGIIEKLEEICRLRNEAMEDMGTVFHRYVQPLYIFYADTDDSDELNTFKATVNRAIKNRENLIIPKEVADKMDIMSIPQYSTLDPIPWIKMLNQYFLMSVGVPEPVLGYSKGTTEGGTKVLILAWQQTVEFTQLYIEEQLDLQLNVKLDYVFPEGITENLQGDERKDGKTQGFKKSELTAGKGK